MKWHEAVFFNQGNRILHLTERLGQGSGKAV